MHDLREKLNILVDFVCICVSRIVLVSCLSLMSLPVHVCTFKVMLFGVKFVTKNYILDIFFKKNILL